MVMATPSPQQVGREFVRQYYTVLHEAPDVLHRFYSSGSTFVHGGVDRPDRPTEEPVVGQLEIDKKIKLLNFKDCHTKIRQVDSQMTIGSGVVVQVTGELSNNGEPMRRFMQTFVLAPQTPKKFYVHNDIFRYQDEVYQDNSDTESEDQQITENIVSKTAMLNMNNYYQNVEQNIQQEEPTGQQSTSSMSSSLPILTSPIQAEQQQHMEQNVELNVQPQVVEEQQNGHSLNGHSNSNSMVQIEEAITQEKSAAVATTAAPVVVESAPVVVEEVQSVIVENVNTSSVIQHQKEELQNQTTETKINSWAKLVQSSGASVLDNTSMLTGTNSQVYQTSQFLSNNNTQKFSNKEQNNTNTNQSAPKSAAPKTNGGAPNKSSHNSNTNKSRNQDTRGNNQQNQTQSNQQNENSNHKSQQSQREPKEPRATTDNNNDDEKKFGRYPDGQQVFVGNLNQDLSETELRTYFSQYGKVMDMRINTNSKQQSGRRLPNYGFVVFEEKQAVENLLSASKANSITYKNDKGIEYRLNVEEKRARQGRISSGYNQKSNRNTRSSSNGSRNGAGDGEQRTQRPKKNTNNQYNNSSNAHQGEGSYEQRREGGFNNRKAEMQDGQIVDNGGRRQNANNPRRS